LDRTGIQGYGGRHHDDDHRGQDADAREARGVLLHPVDHSRYGNERIGAVVESFVPPKGFQNRDAAGREQAVRADDDQDDRDEEQTDHGQWRFCRDGNVIPAAERSNSDERHQPFGLRFLLPDIAPLQQFDRF